MPNIIRIIRDIYYNIIYGVKNLVLWLPIIWQDRNWDFYFIYVMMRYKLNLTGSHILKHNNHTRAEQDAYNIQLCVNLLDRLIADNYHETAFKNHDEKWGSGIFRCVDCTDNPKFQELHIDYINVKTPEDEKQRHADFKRALKHEADLKNQDLDMLFTTMRKHIQGWWD